MEDLIVDSFTEIEFDLFNTEGDNNGINKCAAIIASTHKFTDTDSSGNDNSNGNIIDHHTRENETDIGAGEKTENSEFGNSQVEKQKSIDF